MRRSPLIYVYLGNRLPNYAAHSLRFARRNFSGPIILLTDQDGVRALPGIDVVSTKSWYDREPFTKFSEISPLDALFRGGFWLKAVERFFVLQQYAREFGVEDFLHAELDVLILDLEGFAEKLDREAQGIFIPAQFPTRAIASLVYVNNLAALDELVTFFSKHAELGNEMNMLGHYLSEHPEKGYSLPSETALDPQLWPVTPANVSRDVGLVDSMGFGLWVMGYDPRNIVGTTWNKFSEGDGGVQLGKFRFRASILGRKLWVSDAHGVRRSVRALHLHSKRFARLRVPGMLAFYCYATRWPFRVPVSVSTGKVKHRILTTLLSRKIANVLISIPRLTRPFARGLTNSLVSNTPKILSNRERRVVLSLLPEAPFGLQARAHQCFTVDRDVLTDSRVAWDRLFGPLPPIKRRMFEGQVAVFMSALEQSEPRLVTAGDTAFPLERRLMRGHRQVLFVSDNKAYPDTKHALTFWANDALNNRWSFATRYQLINPDVVWTMFPAGLEDICRWAEMGLSRPEPSLSAFQSYGMWLFSTRARDVVLARP